MDTCNSEFQSWSNIYFTQLFTTLGQLTAVILGGTVAVPVISYYSKNLIKLFASKNANITVGIKAYAKNEGEEWKKAFKTN
jgi:hypothetical protein